MSALKSQKFLVIFVYCNQNVQLENEWLNECIMYELSRMATNSFEMDPKIKYLAE